MISIEEYIQKQIEEAIESCGFSSHLSDSIEILQGRQKGHGDFSANVALKLAGSVHEKPRDIAQKLIDNIQDDANFFDKVEIAGPGFINFTLSNLIVTQIITEVLQSGEKFGMSSTGQGTKVQVEFVSANPTGPLTIGHGRQAVLGDAVARLFEVAGYHVTREYYFNDAGRQMRVLGESVRLRYLELLGENVDFPEDHYQGVYIRDIAEQIIEDKGDVLKNEADVSLFQQKAEEVIFEDIKSTVGRMGIVFDVFFNEKSLYETGKIEAVIQELRNKDLAYDSEGAVWFKTTKFGMDQDRVIIKSTGEPTYRLPDIAYHKDKYDRGFDLIVDIFGADHVATYPDVLAGLKALDYDPSKVRVLIHQFVTLTEGKEKIKMSTRKANFVTLDELMDEVGVDVTKYFFLRRSMNSHLNFDLTLAKTQSEENPVFYVQYAHARICSIIRHGHEQGIDLTDQIDLGLLQTAEELALMKKLGKYPQVVSNAAEKGEPHHIPTYLEDLATMYHKFQHAGKVNSSLRVVTDDVPLTQARLSLCEATRIVLTNGLKLLGISRPERM